MTIQELQTVIQYKLPIKIFIFNNRGYLSIKAHQSTNFQGFYVGAHPETGVGIPDFIKIAKAYGFTTFTIGNQKDLANKIKEALNAPGPVLCDVSMNPEEILSPRLRTRKNADGTLSQSPLEDMWPFLDREEFKKQMIIRPLD